MNISDEEFAAFKKSEKRIKDRDKHANEIAFLGTAAFTCFPIALLSILLYSGQSITSVPFVAWLILFFVELLMGWIGVGIYYTQYGLKGAVKRVLIFCIVWILLYAFIFYKIHEFDSKKKADYSSTPSNVTSIDNRQINTECEPTRSANRWPVRSFDEYGPDVPPLRHRACWQKGRPSAFAPDAFDPPAPPASDT